MTTAVAELRGAARTFAGAQPVTALHPADLVVVPGDLIAVTGRSGSGKSTLLQLIGLLDRPSAGAVLIDGEDTAGLSDAHRTRLRGQRIGFIFQSFHLLPYRTATENVMVALTYHGTPRRSRRSMARAALERVGLGHRLEALPNTMSGGERQRVAIARALVTEPSLVLADEPTGNLDNATADDIMAVLADLHDSGQAILIVTHDEKVAARCARRIRISDGALTELAVVE